ncbi:hypothetical protein C8R34_10358 [Nitrosomonas sp. Nm84]|uniref:hypothetical protein n=1 Tax=Nitrosomonas sp. Nm84 TaxID=200124 RepID=UPI000D9E60E2|nr:hypothetical protein [Nitrosomonas sp. Nm84]PXW89901.1 hypothetical protein C8R34_10358 [Nitrosomonas sp. Nm84]
MGFGSLKGGARGYAFGPLIETISKFEKYEKVDLRLRTDDFTENFDKFEASSDESVSTELNFGMITLSSLLRVCISSLSPMNKNMSNPPYLSISIKHGAL